MADAIDVKTNDQVGQECRQRLTFSAIPQAGPDPRQGAETAEFEIFAITAGDGNGWNFTKEALQKSLPLWDGVECFLDHDTFGWGGRSVRDLAGVVYAPEWLPEPSAVKAKLKAVGPGGTLLTQIGRELLVSAGVKPDVGFSADLRFVAKGKEVQEILRIFSVDLVIDPARGGQFIRALNQKINSQFKEVSTMADSANPKQETTTESTVVDTQLEADKKAVKLLLDEQKKLQTLQTEAAAAHEVRAQMCGYLLDSALTASHLPAAMTAQLRKQFQNVVFEPATLQTAIEDARKLVSELTAGAVVQGPGRITAMYDTRDKLQAAVDDLLGAPRDEALKAVKVQKLSGIRELYMMLTGDVDLHGGYYADRAQLATTADFTGLVKNALNKIVVNTWELLGRAGYDWWTNVVTTQHFNSLNSITGTLVGTVGDLPVVAEGAEYTELAVGDSPETASFVKYGGYIPMTLELIDRDQTNKLSAYAREMASAGLRKVSKLVAAIFTDNSAVGPTLADTGALFNATAVTTKGGHANLLTTALSQAQWDVVSAAVFNQPMLTKLDTGYYGVGPKMAISPKYCLVPRALQLTARQVLLGDWVNATNAFYDNVLKGSAQPLTVPEWTDSNDWAAVCDPAVAPSIFVGERFGLMPEIYIAGDEMSPAAFSNDEHRLKVRHFLAVWVNDYRPLHKENV